MSSAPVPSGPADLLDTLPGRLATERNIWIATVRPDGRPHLVAIWFVAVDDAVWFATGAGSVKVGNLAHEPRISLSLEDGDESAVAEGTATRVALPFPVAVLEAFAEKYDWDISSGTDPDVGEVALVRVDITRWRR